MADDRRAAHRVELPAEARRRRTARGVLGRRYAAAATSIYAAGLALGVGLSAVSGERAVGAVGVAGAATTPGSPVLWWMVGYGVLAAVAWSVAELLTKRSAAWTSR